MDISENKHSRTPDANILFCRFLELVCLVYNFLRCLTLFPANYWNNVPSSSSTDLTGSKTLTNSWGLKRIAKNVQI